MPTVKKPREGDLVKVIRQYLELQGAVVIRNNSGCLRDATNRPVRFGETGSADLVCCLRGGRYLAVEVKGPKGRLRPSQAVWLDRVRSAGGLAVVARTLQDLIDALEALP